MSTTLARQIEEAFRPALAAALGAGTSLRCANADRTGQPLPLPAVVLTAVEEGTHEFIRVAGRTASNLELHAACRADCTAEESSLAAETLAGTVKAAIENPGISTGWLFLQLHSQPDERSWEGGTRVITRVWRVVALASV